MPTVRLAASQLGGLPGLTAYHTSVLLDEDEFVFSSAGISVNRGPASHQQTPQIVELGRTDCTRERLLSTLGSYFQPDTYDLLRKNCNSFTDCALYLLVQQRLDAKYRTLDGLAAQHVDSPLLQAVAGGMYRQNPRAADFDVQQVLRAVGGRDGQGSQQRADQGQALGGRSAQSSDAVRAARLARFTGAGPSGELGGASASRDAAQDSSQSAAASSSRAAASSGGAAEPQAVAMDVDEEFHSAHGGDTVRASAERDQLAADEALARSLQDLENEHAASNSRAQEQQRPQREAQAARPQQTAEDDEALARRLQAEEDRQRRQGDSSRRRSSNPAAPQPGSGPDALLQALGGFVAMQQQQQARGAGATGSGGGGRAAPGPDIQQLLGGLSAAASALDGVNRAVPSEAPQARSRPQQRRSPQMPPHLLEMLRNINPADEQGVANLGDELSRLLGERTPQQQQQPQRTADNAPAAAGAAPAAAAAAPRPQSGAGAARPQQRRPQQMPPQLLEMLRNINAGDQQGIANLGDELNRVFGQIAGGAAGGRPHRSQGLDEAAVRSRTSTMTFDSSNAGTTDDGHRQCGICLQDFCDGEQLRLLPCWHRYHCACIDRWLREHADCPFCKTRI
mmetsp:Transcript_46277/g.110110  ORF Transcript_46277/g.110110 Transcript_46277/m.110110 type:complete len:623 (-) Transcript_46277:226-2094(-)